MLKRIFFLTILIAAIVLAGTAFGQRASAYPPPANGGYNAGWGMNPTNWQTATGTFSAWGLYDPLGGGGGAPWVVTWLPETYITYAPISLELWIEMYSLQTYHYTSYQWHRLGNQLENVSFIIEGTCQSNNGQYISLTRGTEDLDYLWFRENIFGTSSPSPSPDIPISWEGRWGTGLTYGGGIVEGWHTILPDPDITVLIPDPCDHWFQFRGTFTIPYHQPDGYYSLNMAGCPAPVL